MFVSISVGIFVAIFMMFLTLFQSGERWTVAQDKARARRLAEARMNARLLKFNI
jgi:hypothetical protein